MKLIKDENASVLILTVILLPLLIGMIGLIIDTGYIMYQKALLESSTEAAGKSTILLAYDKEIWNLSHTVVVDEALARSEMEKMLKRNFDNAQLISLTVKNNNMISVKTSVDVEFYFMKIFDFKKKTLEVNQVFSGG